ncbi:MAG: GSCFA domain-containing protein [Muribaculaceae bacterium]|nr:GSCFA domain-containing protein [Muribaculaceae bacterium]
MKFRTEYKETPVYPPLDPTRPIVLIGSCFASNIASKMRECQWNAYNGSGTLYNPMSIANVIRTMIFGGNTRDEVAASLFESCGKIHSWLFDSHFSASTQEECIEAIFNMRAELSAALKNAQALIVTFGTSWCYSLADHNVTDGSEYIVSNCHKMPSAMFRRRRLSVNEISLSWIALCKRIKERFPDIRIIFTVSPVRHLKDGFEGNTLSKATLHLAVEQICSSLDYCIYFPAYEIVCDDLRDYRFYANDLVHPSDSAIEYIWEIFRKTFIDDNGERILKDGNKRYKAMHHIPITRNSQQ